MRFTSFSIKNFKGIKSLQLRLDAPPAGRVITLIGLNESGKTTVLEALNYFSYKPETIDILNIPGSSIKETYDIIPLSERGNYTGDTVIKVTLAFDPDDMKAVAAYALDKHKFTFKSYIHELTIEQVYRFENSELQNSIRNLWSYPTLGRFEGSRKRVNLKGSDPTWQGITKFISSRIPAILYFPSFLAEIPERIYLDKNADELSRHYAAILQDILSSIDDTLDVGRHIIGRLNSDEVRDKKSLNGLLLQMGAAVTKSIIEEWASVFGLKMTNRAVVFTAGSDTKGPYAEIRIQDEDGHYSLAERSLGFRWFFGFVLLIGFRSFRRSSLHNPIYLLDEPAANLHPAAQLKVRAALSTFSRSATVIFATHSHHMINPRSLESAYIVRNRSILEDDEKPRSRATDIEVIRYRDFVAKNPTLTHYFQPVLDVLMYMPSDLELVTPAVFVEGKNDFYTIKYFIGKSLKLTPLWKPIPARGSGTMGALVGLYMGWAKPFVILLDADSAGKLEKARYIDEFGPAVCDKVFTLGDVCGEWDGRRMEDLIEERDKHLLVSTCFAADAANSKKLTNRAIQELLMSDTELAFTHETAARFLDLAKFLDTKFEVAPPSVKRAHGADQNAAPALA